MKHPVFNFIPIEKEEYAPRGGQKMLLMKIKDMYQKENYLLFTQMCDNGYRMNRENIDYNKWNQCIFEDIDYKKYIANHNEYIEPNVIFENVYEYLHNNFKDILYYGEFSRSRKGFHFIFYFDVARNKNNRLMCKALCDFVIFKAFNELGYADIIEYNEVFDDCSDSFYQPCFMTLINYKINNECTGQNAYDLMNNNYYSVKQIYDKLVNKIIKLDKHTTKNNSSNKHSNIQHNDYNNSKWKTEFLFDELNKYNGEYMNHHERYYLFKSIVGLCGIENEEVIQNEWQKCAEQLVEGHQHTKTFYFNEPYINHWIEWIKKYEEFCYIDKELLEKFGYNVKFINNQNNENNIKEKTNKTRKTKVYL